MQLFQKDNNLKVDGVLNPKGPTETKIKAKLKSNEKAGNAFGDFRRNQRNLKKTTPEADKYFHCKANYEATKRGWDGEIAAHALSDAKEIIAGIPQIAQHGLDVTIKDSQKDQVANIVGRNNAKLKGYKSAKEACAIFRPKDLNEKY